MSDLRARTQRRLRRAARDLPVIGAPLRRDQRLREQLRVQGDLLAQVDRLFTTPGHFYSPIPALDDIADRAPAFYAAPLPTEIAGINLRADEQLELLAELGPLAADAPWSPRPANGLRYGYDNSNYSYADVLQLFAMLRHLRPKRLVEVGSGHSSCATLDTNERFLDGSMNVSFIEPYPELLYSLVHASDRATLDVSPTGLQEHGIGRFAELEAGDVLFIDSTHVSKFMSDVNHLFFDVLPSLASGVYVHIHDIFYPFEYPRDWVEENRAWNELYLLRAFLQGNDQFEIVLFGHYLETMHRDAVEAAMPDALRTRAGSIWLRKR